MTYKNVYAMKDLNELVGHSVDFVQMNDTKFLFICGTELWGFATDSGMCRWDRIVTTTGFEDILGKAISSISIEKTADEVEGEYANHQMYALTLSTEDDSRAVVEIRVNYHPDCEYIESVRIEPTSIIPSNLPGVFGETVFPYNRN